ncbi:hypothetical protein [Spirosoma linguale]|uniref:Uncharacterized protein n=1 Tax=Spirosoma linguale (strain ATCC 33905 / DSM 74 / LMG 10896 / Claus 1) TaxID=504472 RepID=D2QJJ1_SPILD|nr:hypothetical protein Slin_2891 [Spirosoma linguale DSM 74]
MKHLILFVALCLHYPLAAQTRLRGLGSLVIGLTPPDSLNKLEFVEDDQSYVKGTIALPCTHIRSFTASTVLIEGVRVTAISVYFYDDRLFRISCDYSDALKKVFTTKHGQGLARPPYTVRLCSGERGKPMLIEGEVWLRDDVWALAVQSTGYTSNCERENKRRLDIASQRLLALSSDCELRNVDQALIEFDRLEKEKQRLTTHPEKN